MSGKADDEGRIGAGVSDPAGVPPAAEPASRRPEPLSLNPPRGTHDILPPDTARWQYLETLARQVAQTAGYGEIRVPVFEHTEVFKRGVGETTDIVNKEMYTFLDRSERSLTLRPEGTAGVVRAYLSGGLHRQSPPVKLWYLGPMFRYERTQTGRQRQFHQFGIEAFGSAGPLIDAESIILAVDYLAQVGVRDFRVEVNSIGCADCRPAYRQKLKEHLAPHLPKLCDDCRDRFERNPLRMLDCKSQTCQEHYREVPASLDNLCDACSEHWQGLTGLLAGQTLPYVVNKRLVRGLDYYTRTVFEVISSDPRLGAQSTLCAGGRYDQLVELFGGPKTAAVGWALGLERLLLLLDGTEAASPAAFVISHDPETALAIASQLRQAGISCDMDYPASGWTARGFGKQLQQANKSGAAWAVLAGADELAAGEVALKDMRTGSQQRVSRSQLVAALTELLAACPNS